MLSLSNHPADMKNPQRIGENVHWKLNEAIPTEDETMSEQFSVGSILCPMGRGGVLRIIFDREVNLKEALNCIQYVYTQPIQESHLLNAMDKDWWSNPQNRDKNPTYLHLLQSEYTFRGLYCRDTSPFTNFPDFDLLLVSSR